MYLGNIAKARNNSEAAVKFYDRLININRRYFEAYVELSGLLADKDLQRARNLLRTCLTLNPHYKPAIFSLGDTYRKSNPGIAEKYYKLAETIE